MAFMAAHLTVIPGIKRKEVLKPRENLQMYKVWSKETFLSDLYSP